MRTLTIIEQIFEIIKEKYLSVLGLSVFLCSAAGYFNEYFLLKKFGLNITEYAEINDFFIAGLKNPEVFFINFPLFLFVTTSFLIAAIRLKECEQIQEIMEEKMKILDENYQKLKDDSYLYVLLLNLWYKFYKKKSYKQEQDELYKEISGTRNSIIKLKSANQIKFAIGTIIFIGCIFLIQFLLLQKQYESITIEPDLTATVLTRNNANPLATINPKNYLVLITTTSKFAFFYILGEDNKKSSLVIPVSSIISIKFSEFDKLN